MSKEISPQALSILKKIANDFGKTTSRQETREILRSDDFDTFTEDGSKGVIDDRDNVSLLRDVLYSDLGAVRGKERAKFEKIRERLRQELDQNPRLIEPPESLKNDKFDVRNASLIRDPYVLMLKDDIESPENTEWSRMRLAAKGQEIKLKTSESLNMAQTVLKGKEGESLEERAKILTKSFWENDDGSGKHVFRMDELHGVMEYMNTLPPDQKGEFFKAFQKSMANYISDPKNGLDGQFVMDSLVALLQSTDWTGADVKTKQMKSFVEGLATGIAGDSDFFKNKTVEDKTNGGVVIGNYDGSLYDGNNFGSLALIRDADGKFHFIQHETANPVNKTKYIFDDGAVEADKPRNAGEGGGFAPPLDKANPKPPAADAKPAVEKASDESQTTANKDKAILKVVKSAKKLQSLIKSKPAIEAEQKTKLDSESNKLNNALEEDSLESQAHIILEIAHELAKIVNESKEL